MSRISDDFTVSHTEDIVRYEGSSKMHSGDLYIWVMLNGRRWSWNWDRAFWFFGSYVTYGGGWYVLELGPLTLWKQISR